MVLKTVTLYANYLLFIHLCQKQGLRKVKTGATDPTTRKNEDAGVAW